MAELRAPEQNRLLGQLARMLRTTEGDIAAPEFLPKGLDVMGLVRQLMLPSAETVEKMSYGDPLFRMPMQSNIPITADREYLADVAGMIPFGAPAARPTARGIQDLVRQIQTEPPTGAISPEIAARALPNTKAVKNDEPVMLYSGSQNEIQQFDDRSGIAFPAWFTDRPDVASAYAVDPTRAARGERSPTVYPSYLDLQNPLVLDAKGAKWNNIKVRDKDIADELEIDAPVSTTFLAYAARQKGYDGVIIKNVKDNPNAEVSGVSDVYVPFSPEQIRSATSDPQMAGLLDQPAQSVAETSYRGSHSAPNVETYGATLDSLEGIMPADVYSSRGKRLYGLGNPDVDAEWFAAAFKAKGKPDAEVTVYRAVPKGVKEINSGDWVTTSKTYADMHGENAIGDDYEILSKKVKAKTLSSEGYPYEFGYNE